MLEKLLAEKLVDYVAMDVKGPKELYSLLTGTEADISKIERSMAIVQKFPEYEFRTTIVPVARSQGISWLSAEEAEKTARWLAEITENNEHKYFLQKFVARKKEEMMDERLSAESLPEEMQKTPKKLLEEMLEAVQRHLPSAQIR